MLGSIYSILDKMRLRPNKEEYGPDGKITLGVNVEEQLLVDLVDRVNDASSGQVEVRRIGS